MSSYINIFGGSPVQVADPSYLAIALSGDITLSWPTQFQDTNNVVARIMDVTPSNNGFTITLPDATQTSVGSDFLINNISGTHSFEVLDNEGDLLVTFSAQALFYFYLIDNTTTEGTWRVIPFGLGIGSVVTQVAATPATAGLTITGSPITSSGTFGFSLSNELVALNNVATTGLLTQTAANTVTTVSLVQGSNIVITNPGGILGNPTIAVSTTPSGLTSLGVGNLSLSGSTIITGSGNLPISLTPNGTGNVLFPVGSASIPGLAFTGDTTTGFYRPSAGEIAFSSAGAEIILLSPLGIGLGGGAPLNSATNVLAMAAGTAPNSCTATTLCVYGATATGALTTLGLFTNSSIVSATGGGLTPDHNFTIVINGTTYYVPCKTSQS